MNNRSGIYVSALNTNIVETLDASETFNGAGEDISQFAETSINLYGEPALAPGTLFFEYSRDGSNWDVSVPYVLAGPQSFVPLPLRAVLPFFRVRYTNGSTPLTVFRLTTVHHWQNAKHITRVVNQSIDENEPVEMNRSIQTGKSPDGPYTNLPATGTVSSQSSNTPLSANASFNGSVISTAGYLSASVTVISNINSAANGLTFNWYANSAGTRSLGSTSFTYGNAPNATSVQVPIKGPFFNITYTNGGTLQSTFELSTSLSVTSPPPDVLPISSTITGNNAAQIVKANVVGLQENGTYSNVGLSNSGSMKIAITDRPSEVRSRTYIIANIDHISLSATPTVIYTVTGGKIFYLQNIILSMINQANAVGRLNINDNGTVVIPITISSKPAGATEGQFTQISAFTEPIHFTNNVRATEVAGDVIASITIVGYEE